VDGEHARVAHFLQDDADSVSPGPIRRPRVFAQYLYCAGVALSIAFQDFDGRGFACTIGPEDRKDLAVADVEV
jgi:hypothetical protein